MAAAVLSELFLIDAQQLAGELQRFVRGANGATPIATASSADALADLLRTLELPAYSSCSRTLSRSLLARTSVTEADRKRAASLTERLVNVLGALRVQQVVDDDPDFAAAWLAQFPKTEALPGEYETEAEPQPVTKTSEAVAAPVQADVAAEAALRAVALAQARRLHDSLAQANPSSRSGIERVIAQLLGQVRVSCAEIGGHQLPAGLTLSTEGFEALSLAVRALPLARSVSAAINAGVFSLDLDALKADAAALEHAAVTLAHLGGRIDKIPTGIRLSLPCDTQRPKVVVLQVQQGWVAVHALQFEGLSIAKGPASRPKSMVLRLRYGSDDRILSLTGSGKSAEAPASAWRYELPAGNSWLLPGDWQAMVRDSSGRVMPLLAGGVQAAPVPAPAPAPLKAPAPVKAVTRKARK